MAKLKSLRSDQLRKRCSLAGLRFKTTERLKPIHDCASQPRVEKAFDYALKNRHRGYNVFAMGSRELEIDRVVGCLIDAEANERPTVPDDWIYVHNFEDPRRPRALHLPAGRGRQFAADVETLIEDLATAIPASLDSDEYRGRLKELEDEFERRHESALELLKLRVGKSGFLLIQSPGGITIAPAKDGTVMGEDQLKKLSKKELVQLNEKLEAYQEELQKIVQEVPRWRKEYSQSLKGLNRDVGANAVSTFVTELLQNYLDLPDIVEHVETIAVEVLENIHLFGDPRSELPAIIPGIQMPGPSEEGDRFLPFRVNLFVDNSGSEHAPIIRETNPNFVNLNGRIEHSNDMGALITDFTLMKAGALHRANGGYLVIDARSLLLEPYAWESLKRALKVSSLRLESLGQAYGLISMVSLEPEPIPLDVKVVLVGDRGLYHLLQRHDPEFSSLFRVVADFDEDLEWTPINQRVFTRRLATLLKRDKLLPLDAPAVARVIEEAARHASDSGKLTLHSETVSTLLHEADFLVREDGRDLVGVEDIVAAVAASEERGERIPSLVYDGIEEKTVLVDTEGSAVGQVNGLSVLGLGGQRFGQPSRITARARAGAGGIVDIEREVDLGGAIHSKGVMILTGYLLGQFLPDERLSLSARIAFEQSYGGVDGDSASSAELYALLSAISGIPLRQDVAVTGSMNQHGQVQAIGGVNEKIEGFFEVCRRRGLTGTQGVLIPEANVRHLMLRAEVVEACERGDFHVYPVARVEDGIEFLTGIVAGSRGKAGCFPKSSVFGQVEEVLGKFSKLLHSKNSEATK